jgi:hypothetical protein
MFPSNETKIGRAVKEDISLLYKKRLLLYRFIKTV